MKQPIICKKGSPEGPIIAQRGTYIMKQACEEGKALGKGGRRPAFDLFLLNLNTLQLISGLVSGPIPAMSLVWLALY